MLEKTFHQSKWRWQILDPNESGDRHFPPSASEGSDSWMAAVREGNTNNLEMKTTVPGNESMSGGFIYYQDVEHHEKRAVLHYDVSRELLVTTPIKSALLHDISEEELMEKLEKAENAVEGFLIILSEVIAAFLQKIDAFEHRMHKLLWQLKEKNNEKLFNQMMHNRHEILLWKNLVIPIFEIQEAVAEAFGREITENIHYYRAKLRIQRCRNIIQEYNEEIGEMIDIETVTSSQRGNEIVKTLTVITLLFTPASAFGAIWGMNFVKMPELEWSFGYPLALILIALTTWGFYYYLKKKNWMGSLLRTLKD